MERLEDVKLFLLEHRWMLIVGLLLVGLVLGGGYFIYQSFSQEKEKALVEATDLFQKNNEDSEELIVEDSCQVIVDVKGEVKQPGLYQLDCDDRVQDAIMLAGGTTWKADTSVLNLSKKLLDEMIIIVYSKDQVANFVVTKEEEALKQESCQNQLEIANDACIDDSLLESSKNESDIGDTPVDNTISINKASKDELMTLPGIGESKADNIINYREEIGGFQSIEEIKNVKGIGDSVFEKIKANITV